MWRGDGGLFCSFFSSEEGTTKSVWLSFSSTRNILLFCNTENYSMMQYYLLEHCILQKNQPKSAVLWSVLQVLLVSVCFLLSFVCLIFFPFTPTLFQLSFLFSSPSFSITPFCVFLLTGVPPQVLASGLRAGPDRSPQAFNGCIHNVRINGEPQDLSYRAAGGRRPQGLEGKVMAYGFVHVLLFLILST